MNRVLVLPDKSLFSVAVPHEVVGNCLLIKGSGVHWGWLAGSEEVASKSRNRAKHEGVLRCAAFQLKESQWWGEANSLRGRDELTSAIPSAVESPNIVFPYSRTQRPCIDMHEKRTDTVP